MTDGAIIVFAREPVPGRVKTRLAKEIGDLSACEAYRTLRKNTLNTIQRLNFTKYLYLPPGDQVEPQLVDQGFIICKQNGADLGRRMRQAFEECFQSGHGRIVLAGSDCPYITSGLIRRAFDELSRFETVIGPAVDGGYYLVGQSAYCRDLFSGIPWSTSSVWKLTRERLEERQWSFGLLPLLEDIDTLDAWERYKKKAE